MKVEKTYTVEEAAEYLGLHPDSVYAAIKRGALRYGRMTDKPQSPYIISQSALDDYNKRRGVAPAR